MSVTEGHVVHVEMGEAGASGNVAAASLGGADSIGPNSETQLVKTPSATTLPGLARVDSMSRLEKDAFERGMPLLFDHRKGTEKLPFCGIAVQQNCLTHSKQYELLKLA